MINYRWKDMIILLIDCLIKNHNKMSKYSSKTFECSGEKIKKIMQQKIM